MIGSRPIKSVFYRHDLKPVVNSSSDADRAVGFATAHMRSNKYNAHTCEIYNADTGIDEVSMRWTLAGELIIVEKNGQTHPVE